MSTEAARDGSPFAVTDVLRQWAAHTPDAVAIQASDGALTFAEVVTAADRIAARLVEIGVGAETTVALTCGRSKWSLPSLVGVWQAGGVAVPLDARHPVRRNHFVVGAAAPVALLGDDLDDGVVGEDVLRMQPAAIGRDGDAPRPSVRHGDDDCAYVVYTSGTSGQPKGVEVTFAALGTFVDALGELGLATGGLGINAVSPAFDGWLWCMLLYLVHGHGMVVVDVGTDGVGETLADRVLEIRPRTVCLTPSLAAMCDRGLGGAQTLVVAGEACPPALLERFADVPRILNVYGPTEAVIAATWSDSAAGDDVTTIGRPRAGMRAYVVAEDGSRAAVGRPGELCLAGRSLARGYRNDPELTAARFVPDRFHDGDERMYRTGDLVVERPDGQLEFRGRIDTQVKVRGVRIELEEVEAVALGLEDVQAASAFVGASGEVLGLAVVPEHAEADHDALRRRVVAECADALPATVVPTIVHVLDAIPVTPSGKADRARLTALPAVAVAAAAGTAVATAPATELEALVCEVWGELLEQPVDDVHAGFFDLGGHSLLAARAIASLRRRTGVQVSMAALLAHPTAHALAAEIARLESEQSVEAS